jgi:hypothetical protein
MFIELHVLGGSGGMEREIERMEQRKTFLNALAAFEQPGQGDP